MASELSGNFVLRIPPQLHGALKKKAAQAGLSLNEYCRRALQGALTESTAGQALPHENAWLARIGRLLGEGLLGVVLFGSTARGRRREGSDTDLLIVVDSSLPLSRKLYSGWDEMEAEPCLSPHYVHLPRDAEQAGSLWLEAAVDGLLLLDKTGAVNRFLRRLREEMASGRLIRKSAYGHPYWVRTAKETSDV